MSSLTRRSAYRASYRVTGDTVRAAAAAAAPPPASDAKLAVTAALAARVPAPPPPQPQQQPQPQPEVMHLRLAQVPRGEGTDATWSRRARRARGGNRRGRERRLLCELAEPAVAAAAADGAAPPPMLRESNAGQGGAPPRTRPWPGRDGPPGQGAPGIGCAAGRPTEPCAHRRGLRRGWVLCADRVGVVGLLQSWEHAVSCAGAWTGW